MDAPEENSHQIDVSKLTEADYEKLSQKLMDQESAMELRLRSVFTLRSIKTDRAVVALKPALVDPSVLLAHEVAYVMGQMQNPSAVPFLISTLENPGLNPMVRHEAAEALGALGGEQALVSLKQWATSEIPEVRDTCLIAIALLEWKAQNPENKDDNAFHPLFGSVDPAPPAKAKDVAALRAKLLDRNKSIFSRYRAMFALRNIASSEAVAALADALNLVDEGAVFAHEVAYVLGQISHKGAIEALQAALSNPALNDMIRHEAAEALGNIADESIVPVLQKFKDDASQPVSQSCVVALDILAYNNSNEFQYADALLSS